MGKRSRGETDLTRMGKPNETVGFLILIKEVQWGRRVPTPRYEWRPELSAWHPAPYDLSKQLRNVLFLLLDDDRRMTMKSLQAE